MYNILPADWESYARCTWDQPGVGATGMVNPFEHRVRFLPAPYYGSHAVHPTLGIQACHNGQRRLDGVERFLVTSDAMAKPSAYVVQILHSGVHCRI